MNNLTLIIPAKNEAESLPIVLEELKNLNCKILVSMKNDDILTINSIKNHNIKIHYQSKSGYGNSLIEAIQNCETELFCIFNADGSFDKEDLIKMRELCIENEFVFASRYLKNAGSDDDTFITYVGNKIFSLIGKVFFKLNLNDILYTYVMGKTSYFNKLNIKSDDFRFCVEFPIKMKLSKMKYTSISSYEKKRLAGKKKVNALKDGFLILSEMLKLFFRYKVIRNRKI
ncbi:glycosyltransferase [Candidatus Pelagibacter sp.]|nr:glycosyltransferase [Candidatus Pelagibacter sp.]